MKTGDLKLPPGESECTPAGWGLFIGGFLSLMYLTEEKAREDKRVVESTIKTTAPIEVRQLFSREEK